MVWDNKYETGIKEIDKQHIKWLSLITDLLDALLKNTIKQNIDYIFDEAFEYTQTHLKYEEELMVKNNYPDLKKHKELHNNMTVHLNNIKLKLEDAKYIESNQLISEEIIELSQMFQNWLINHIETEDKKYVPYIK